ncbi:MAG: hypothetical protein R2736_20875 [Solirubrobacterales bacterium]
MGDGVPKVGAGNHPTCPRTSPPYARAFLTLVAELGVVGAEAAPRP